MKPVLMLVLIGTSALAVAACGGSTQSSAIETDTTVTTTAAPPVTTESTPAKPVAKAPRPTTITIVVEQGRPKGGIKRPAVRKGDRVVLVIRADAGEALHLHGYDIEKKVTPGTPVRIPFTANLPGRFELELHHPDALLAVIEVRP